MYMVLKWIVEARYKNIVDFIYIAVCIEVLAALRFEKDGYDERICNLSRYRSKGSV